MTESAAEWVSITDLTPWEQNPRNNDHAVADVASSIERFGFASPIIARLNGEVIAGHTRLKAALSLGLDRVPVRYMDLDPADAKMLALADNKIGELADWNQESLAEILQGLADDDLDLDGLGWSGDELSALLDGDDEEQPDDEIPDLSDDVHSKPGEIYHLGAHRLICGDCRDPDVVSRLLDGELINVAFTSPPYASQRTYDESSGFKPIKPDAYVEWFDAVQANVRKHLADDGSWFVNIKEHCEDGQRHLYVKDLTIAHVRLWDWRFVDEFCWKRGGVPGKWPNRLKNQWEPVFHFSRSSKIKLNHTNVMHESTGAFGYSPDNPKSTTGFFSNRGRDDIAGDGMALPGNVLTLGAEGRQTSSHTAPFPVALPAFFVKAFSDEGDTILDPFMGSGTTMIASEQTGRVSYGCEISPKYCDVIRRRWTNYALSNQIDAGSGALE